MRALAKFHVNKSKNSWHRVIKCSDGGRWSWRKVVRRFEIKLNIDGHV